jgi:hypothetical protein
MLRIQPRLREIRIGSFDQRVLIAMPKLFLKADISLWLIVFRFARPFLRVLVDSDFRHDSSSTGSI